jgi:glycosyltransferase involved in cell wall biosynthesis
MIMKTRVRVSIVIPAYNEERHLRSCLEAVANQTATPFEVIVVDNNSTDKTAQIAREFPFVRLIREPRQGRVFARNAGFDVAKGDIIGRIDADITLPLEWVAHVQRFYSGSKHSQEAWTGAGYFPNIRMPRLSSFGYALLAFRLNKLLTGHYTLWGSNMALTAVQWQRVHSQVCERNDIHEDLDLAIHLDKAGYAIHYDRGIKTNAELRRVQTDRHELWGYLQWWPRTLRIHGKNTWVICWFFGVLLLYLASFVWLFMDTSARALTRRALALRPATGRQD